MKYYGLKILGKLVTIQQFKQEPISPMEFTAVGSFAYTPTWMIIECTVKPDYTSTKWYGLKLNGVLTTVQPFDYMPNNIYDFDTNHYYLDPTLTENTSLVISEIIGIKITEHE